MPRGRRIGSIDSRAARQCHRVARCWSSASLGEKLVFVAAFAKRMLDDPGRARLRVRSILFEDDIELAADEFSARRQSRRAPAHRRASHHQGQAPRPRGVHAARRALGRRQSTPQPRVRSDYHVCSFERVPGSGRDRISSGLRRDAAPASARRYPWPPLRPPHRGWVGCS
jgi:hypothetical protein